MIKFRPLRPKNKWKFAPLRPKIKKCQKIFDLCGLCRFYLKSAKVRKGQMLKNFWPLRTFAAWKLRKSWSILDLCGLKMNKTLHLCGLKSKNVEKFLTFADLCGQKIKKTLIKFRPLRPKSKWKYAPLQPKIKKCQKYFDLCRFYLKSAKVRKDQMLKNFWPLPTFAA